MDSSSNSCMIGNEESGWSVREAGRCGKGGAACHHGVHQTVWHGDQWPHHGTQRIRVCTNTWTSTTFCQQTRWFKCLGDWYEVDCWFQHEISKGAKSSANALNAVESGMRKVGGLASNGECQTSYHHIQFDKSYILRTITLNLFDDHELFTLSDSLESAWVLCASSSF